MPPTRDLDASRQLDASAAWLDRIAALAPVREGKRRSFELLDVGPEARVLDVGCGTGVDIPALARLVSPGGEVVGVDSSAGVLAAAERVAADLQQAVAREARGRRLTVVLETHLFLAGGERVATLPGTRPGARLHVMAIEVPPAGTRGTKAPPTGPLARGMMGVVRQIHRLTGNKMSGQPLMHLHTVGAKSGQPRTTVVMAFDDGPDTWLVVASRGGTADHPAWFYNMAANPERIEVEIGGRRMAVSGQTLTGEERVAAWQRITTAQPRFKGYEQKTDRQLPVVRLTAR